MKRLITICAAAGMILAISGTAQATVTFDFNSLADGATAAAISTYMTSIYTVDGYGSITVTDATARKDTSSSGGYDWPGNLTTFIWTAGGYNEKDFEILFVTTPITALLGLGGTGSTVGFVYDETYGDDFAIFAYDSDYATGTYWYDPPGPTPGSWIPYDAETPNPSALVTSWSISDLSDKTQVSIPDLLFSRPVSLLVISDSGQHDVAIDNLTVTPDTPVPEPATVALLGLGALSLLRRKRSV